jgi:hypothetical protein
VAELGWAVESERSGCGFALRPLAGEAHSMSIKPKARRLRLLLPLMVLVGAPVLDARPVAADTVTTKCEVTDDKRFNLCASYNYTDDVMTAKIHNRSTSTYRTVVGIRVKSPNVGVLATKTGTLEPNHSLILSKGGLPNVFCARESAPSLDEVCLTV